MRSVTPQPGSSAEFTVEVGADDTALALGSGDVPVLGTPRVVALLEQATVRAVAGQLPDGNTTVGVAVDIAHRRATAAGGRIRVTARLVEVSGPTLTFEVAAYEGDRPVADGTVRRAIVDREAFLARARGAAS